ncbi:MAG: hypothetical protein QW478_04700 [Candidatus Micrarchaeaceae archaeon]
MNIYVDDKIIEEYNEALAKLKADKYADKLPEAEKEKLERAVLRKLLIDQFLVYIEELNEGADPYDYKEIEYISLEKALE